MLLTNCSGITSEAPATQVSDPLEEQIQTHSSRDASKEDAVRWERVGENRQEWGRRQGGLQESGALPTLPGVDLENENTSSHFPL